MHESTRRYRCRLLLGPALAVSIAGWAVLYRDAAPTGHTGGFGEPTCHSCHSDHDLNDPRGTIEIRGVPDVFMPGETYSVAVVLQHPEMKRGGFQASARFADGERAGRQAGHWAASGEDDVRLDPDSSDAVYATHVEPSGQRGRAVWRFSWRAPREGERVVFHVAGNASNDDNSEFGDFIVLGSHEIMPIPAAARK